MFVTKSTVNITYVKKIDVKKNSDYNVRADDAFPRLLPRLFSSAAIYYFVKRISRLSRQEIYGGVYISQLLSKLSRRSNNVRLSRVKFDGGWCKYNVRVRFRAHDYLGDGLQASTSIQPVVTTRLDFLRQSTRWTIARELWTVSETFLVSKRIVIAQLTQNDVDSDGERNFDKLKLLNRPRFKAPRISPFIHFPIYWHHDLSIATTYARLMLSHDIFTANNVRALREN